jgi:hypothetical protein
MTYFMDMEIKKIHGAKFWNINCSFHPVSYIKEDVNVLGLKAIRHDLQKCIEEINKHIGDLDE